MSLKAIEMQIALPRTFEASKLHGEMQQHGANIQSHLMEATQKEDVKKRKTVSKSEKKGNALLSSNPHPVLSEGQFLDSKNIDGQKDLVSDIHPYKGTVFDISG